MTAPAQQVRVGVGVFVIRPSPRSADGLEDIEFVIGKRMGSHGSGTWALPGGHLEVGESFETCAAREVMEETGLQINGLRFLTATNDVMTDEGRHYVTIFMVGSISGAQVEPQVMEEDKCEGWEWIRWLDFVDWAKRQMQVGETQRRAQIEERHARLSDKLFSPLLRIVEQRQGVMPSLP